MVFGLFSKKKPADVALPPSPPPTTIPPPTPSPPPLLSTSELRSLILTIPPNTLHTYTLSRLSSPPPSPSTLASISSFFADLHPPPLLHCVRCHKDYYDVENTDRSCLVHHDDESAEVERVGRSGAATEYETLWGCCSRTVEGDGDMGPPDGWCYEGKHTASCTDLKRARFRADSTPSDDRLQSCFKLNCHNIRDTLRRDGPRRKRARDSDDDQDGDDEGEEDSGMEDIVRAGSGSARGEGSRRDRESVAGSTRGGRKGKGKGKAKQEEDTNMKSDESPQRQPRPKSKAVAREKPTSSRKPKSKSRVRTAAKKLAAEDYKASSGVEGDDAVEEPKPKKKRKVVS